jgi:hypothetical protein
MYFCSKCDYTFDISNSNSKINIDSVNGIFEIPIDEISNYSANFDKSKLLKLKKYKILSEENKEKYEVLFDTSINKIQFQCLNCNYTEPITNSMKLYEINLENDIVINYKSKEENKLIFNNPILPRTRDYTCKNINCISHKDTSKKEAIFYKDKQTNNLTYLCGVCYTSWI